MGLRKILTDKEPALHKVCKTVEKFDWKLHKLLDDMRETLIESNGVGLAAPQVGILRRVVLVDTGDEILELVNPELLETDGEQVGAEGCLSVPNKYGLVKRPYYAKVRARIGTATGTKPKVRRSLPAASAMSWIIWMASCTPRLWSATSPTRNLIRTRNNESLEEDPCELCLWARRILRRPA